MSKYIKEKEKKSNEKKDKEKIETSKIVLFIVFFICIEILIYTEIVVLILKDSTTLYTLVSVPVTLVPITLGYYWKARSQNIKGGITYDTAIMKLENDLGITGNTLDNGYDVSLGNVINDVMANSIKENEEKGEG